MSGEVFEKAYVDKETLRSVQVVPVPDDLENWIEIDFDETFNYRGKIYNIQTGEFDVAPPTDSQNKSLGVEIQGKMISLNESNQNGLAAISTMIDKSIKLGLSPFPVYPSLEMKGGKARLVANTQEEFDGIFVTFGLARQPFFV
jgi:hypothetical protein